MINRLIPSKFFKYVQRITQMLAMLSQDRDRQSNTVDRQRRSDDVRQLERPAARRRQRLDHRCGQSLIVDITADSGDHEDE